jgi:hypothetical protein
MASMSSKRPLTSHPGRFFGCLNEAEEAVLKSIL